MTSTAQMARDFRHSLSAAQWAQDRAGVTPDPWQAELLDTAKRRVVAVTSRQAGKSTTTGLKGAHWALYRPGSLILLCAPSHRQSVLLHEKVLKYLDAADPDLHFAERNKTSAKLGNGSEIISVPGSPDTIRGYSPDLIALDEVAFFDDQRDILPAILPMMAAKPHGQIVLISTPNGRRGDLWKIWSDEQADWQRITANADNIPRYSADDLAEQRRIMGDNKFRQEYLCEFLAGAGGVFDLDSIARAFNRSGSGRIDLNERPKGTGALDF